ncbi:hypothetical protein LIER_16425 [Lithospermum erythrorhizon]|uniref:Uncharacterized protein n=1 Tax=Lithospermum erythrorhizon TaxID=34254 RepID=A0AAV3Q9T6_LITER
MRGQVENRDKSRYYEYHREYGHDIHECRMLKVEMEKLIKRGHLKEFVDTRGGGDSRNSRKNYARREVYSSSSTPKSVQAISFSDAELQGLELPHDDLVVIAPIIANYTVERMLVDTGSSADILYLSTYDKLGLSRNRLQPMHILLIGFTGHSVYPKGMATLDFTVGSGNKKSMIRAQFTIVDIPDLSYYRSIG